MEQAGVPLDLVSEVDSDSGSVANRVEDIAASMGIDRAVWREIKRKEDNEETLTSEESTIFENAKEQIRKDFRQGFRGDRPAGRTDRSAVPSNPRGRAAAQNTSVAAPAEQTTPAAQDIAGGSPAGLGARTEVSVAAGPLSSSLPDATWFDSDSAVSDLFDALDAYAEAAPQLAEEIEALQSEVTDAAESDGGRTDGSIKERSS